MVRRLDPTVAESVMRAAGLEPLVDYPGSANPWLCRCMTCGKHVTPGYKSIQEGRGGCRFCAGKAVDPQDAVAAMHAAGLEPLVDYPGNGEPWPCRCMTCGKQVTPRYNSISKGRGGCRFCAGIAVEVQDVVAVMHAAGLEPLVDYPGHGEPWLCRCMTCGKQVTPRYASIQNGSGGCRTCAWNLTAPGRSMGIYLISHDAFNAVKVGVGVVNGARSARLVVHGRRGWELLAHWTGITDHRIAFAVERQILARWAREGIQGHLRAEQMPQFGATETAPLDRVNLDDLVGEITLAIEKYSDVYLGDEDIAAA